MEEVEVVADNSNTAEEVALETTVEVEESVEEVKARAQKAEELAQNYKIRAEKAERKAKEQPKAEVRSEVSTNLSTDDVFTLVKSNVHQDDVSEVREYAKMKNLSIQEALKSNVVKTILRDNAEKRQTAQATNTGPARRTTPAVTDDSLLERARKDDLPDSHEDLMRIARARKGLK